jgi:hypothetical protein
MKRTVRPAVSALAVGVWRPDRRWIASSVGASRHAAVQMKAVLRIEAKLAGREAREQNA